MGQHVTVQKYFFLVSYYLHKLLFKLLVFIVSRCGQYLIKMCLCIFQDIEFMEKKVEDLEKSMKRSNDKQLKIEHECCMKVMLFEVENAILYSDFFRSLLITMTSYFNFVFIVLTFIRFNHGLRKVKTSDQVTGKLLKLRF